MAQIITSKKAGPPRINRGNIFDFLQSNPNNVSPQDAAFIRVDGKQISRAQLFSDARRLAYGLRHTLGLQPGSRIGIFSPNSTAYPIAVHAGLCAGIVLVPLNAAYGSQELVHPLHDADVQYILCHHALLPVARQGLELANIGPISANGRNRLWILDEDDELKKGEQGEEDVRILMSEDELETHKVVNPVEEDAFIAYSSGTSGRPKGVQLTHSNMTSVTSAALITMGEDLTHKDRIAAVLPFNHIFGLAKYVHFAVMVGAPAVVIPRYDLDVFCSVIEKQKCTLAFVVPPILVQLAKDPRASKYDLSSLRYLFSGAAPLGSELSQEVEKKYPFLRVTQGWGLTETSPTATVVSYKDYRKYMGSCGTLVAGLEARIVDDNGKDVGLEQGETGKPGELWIRGPTIMKGYLNNKEATDDCITPDGWFKSGDIAIMRDGYFWIVDRKKELIKFKGFQVAPAELEALLLSHPKVADVAVVGVYDDSQATELPKAYIVANAEGKRDGAEALSSEIVEWTAKKVANHMRLRGGVELIDVIPKSPSGKILRRILRDAAAEKQKKNKKV
ncbi:acetyl-CoA synthetase-like protein [Violaceomyces palustris]|uniref:Acetyl-CoA synthetase-like protein n=1 Tax=Violaceomyces palustris TaxID=1673888 RepID=A0ACD0NN67_9BASI|nr:acetyl-CoA synthetase-like protein [Violaceomyces palustris]